MPSTSLNRSNDLNVSFRWKKNFLEGCCVWCDVKREDLGEFEEWKVGVKKHLILYFPIPADHITYCCLHAKLRYYYEIHSLMILELHQNC
jgi:hypothetical protein